MSGGFVCFYGDGELYVEFCSQLSRFQRMRARLHI